MVARGLVDNPRSNRELHLEGLRGLAALTVMSFHYLYAFFPFAIAGVGIAHSHFEKIWFRSPWEVFTSGVFAVAIFFVLSGYVLSILFFRLKDTDILRTMALKRYIRLGVPAATSVLIAYVFLKLHIFRPATLAHAISPNFPLDWNFTPKLFDALYQAFWGAYLSTGAPAAPSNPALTYNGVLWTLAYEFLGSMFIFGFLALVGKLRFRWLAYGLLLIITSSTCFLGFIFGMIIADITANHDGVVRFLRRPKIILPLMALVGLYLGGFPFNAVDPGPWYNWLWPRFSNIDMYRNFWMTIGASLITASINWSGLARRLLSARPLVTLGSYTYSIYLIHIFFRATLLPVLFIGLRGVGMSYGKAAIISIVASVGVVIFAGKYFTRFVDAPAIRMSRAFAKIVMQDQLHEVVPRLRGAAAARLRTLGRVIPFRRHQASQQESS
jgi:peptidoglycan/LPS O-acetylase OafA/YrhL